MKRTIVFLLCLVINPVTAGELTDSQDLKRTFEAIQQIHVIAAHTAKQAKDKDGTRLKLATDTWSGPTNPNWGRTKQGLCLWMEKTYPHHLETPWGEVNIFGTVNFTQDKGGEAAFVINTFCQNLTLKALSSKLYAIESVNGQPVPPLQFLLQKDQLLWKYDETVSRSIQTSWQTMMKAHGKVTGSAVTTTTENKK